MPKLTIEDLKKMRDDSVRMRQVRDGEARAVVNVHLSTCGITAGAREVMTTLLNELEKRKLPDVIVTTSACAGLCAKEPMVTVSIRGEAPVKYADLSPARIIEVLEQHILRGKVVAEYALGRGSEKTV